MLRMSTLPGRLGTLTARDVMTRAVIVLSEDESVDEAVVRLKEHHITGAPVIDESGKLVGILSLQDIVAQPGAASPSDRLASLGPGEGVTAWNLEGATAWNLFDRGGSLDSETGIERVSQRMSRQVASVAEHVSLVDTARVMCDGHWHRVPVVDSGGALCGIISSMDVLAALVNAADEAG